MHEAGVDGSLSKLCWCTMNGRSWLRGLPNGRFIADYINYTAESEINAQLQLYLREAALEPRQSLLKQVLLVLQGCYLLSQAHSLHLLLGEMSFAGLAERVHMALQPLKLHLQVGSNSLGLQLEHVKAGTLVVFCLHRRDFLHMASQILAYLSDEALK